MKHSQKIAQRKPRASEGHAAGPNAIAIAPPAYGIDVIDQGVVQREPEPPPYESLHGKVSPNRIAEGQWARVGRGGTVLFTALAAGCLAITTVFEGGGGAGLHMALNLPNSAQWNQLRDAVAAKKIATVYLESDMVGQNDGWHVKLDKESYANQTEYSPRSAAELQAEFGDGFGEDGWISSRPAVISWFKEVFGTDNVVLTTTNQAVAHQC